MTTPRKAQIATKTLSPQSRPKKGAASVVGHHTKSLSGFVTQSRASKVASEKTPVTYARSKEASLRYEPSKGVDDYVMALNRATPGQIILTERMGVHGQLLKDLSKRMDVPAKRLFHIVGIPKATAEKKVAAGQLVGGSEGQATLGMVKLLGIAREIVDSSTAREAKGFDSAKWLGQWIERPQRALGGEKPADLLDTPTGIDVVARLLGSITSGAFQ